MRRRMVLAAFLFVAATDPRAGVALADESDTMVPKGGARVVCERGTDAIYRFPVEGRWGNPDRDHQALLLWVKPVQPSAGGWYLQQPPHNGINAVEPSGAWRGTGQIGNLEYPPRDGNVMDIAVTVVEKATADRALSEPGGRPQGQPSGRVMVESKGVIVSLR